MDFAWINEPRPLKIMGVDTGQCFANIRKNCKKKKRKEKTKGLKMSKPHYRKPDLSLDVHRGNAKPLDPILPECLINKLQRDIERFEGTCFKQRVSVYQCGSGLNTTHAAQCSPIFFPMFSLFSLQCWPDNWCVQFWPPPLHPLTRIHLSPGLWLSKTALCAGQHGAASVASASRALFFPAL